MTVLVFSIIVVALVFEFINGFHDTANAIATSVYSKTLKPRQAIMMAACMNFLGALFGENVASTISSGIIGVEIQEHVVLAAILGAISWNLITWWKGIPSSSSHALIGSLIGATIMNAFSFEGVIWDKFLEKIIIPLFTSPILGFVVAFFVMKLIFKLVQNVTRSKANKVFKVLQTISAAFMAFSHGTNDAQKTMGIITLTLVSAHLLPLNSSVPIWVKIICALSMAFGTSIGGWKIMKTMGGRVSKINASAGFAAEMTSGIVIESMSFIGAPISTTQVITSAVMGTGSAKRFSSVKWGVIKNILITWVLTIPAVSILGASFMFLLDLFF